MGGSSGHTQKSPRTYLTYRADANQPEIVRTFRQLGYSVEHAHAVGKGFPDIAVGKFDLTWIVEIKDGSKIPSARQFTPRQREFNFQWRGNRCVISSIEEVISFDNQVKIFIEKLKNAGIDWKILGCRDSIYQISLY